MSDGECRGCGVELAGGGYLCDGCDTLEIADCLRRQQAVADGGERDE